MKLGKEVKLNIKNKNFKSNLGCIENYKNPYSVYVELSTWIKKSNEDNLDNKYFSTLKNKIKKFIVNHHLCDGNFKNVILLMEVSEERVNKDMKTFLSIEMNMVQKNNLQLVSKNNSSIKLITEELLDDLIDFISQEKFKFYLKKGN